MYKKCAKFQLDRSTNSGLNEGLNFRGQILLKMKKNNYIVSLEEARYIDDKNKTDYQNC